MSQEKKNTSSSRTAQASRASRRGREAAAQLPPPGASPFSGTAACGNTAARTFDSTPATTAGDTAQRPPPPAPSLGPWAPLRGRQRTLARAGRGRGSGCGGRAVRCCRRHRAPLPERRGLTPERLASGSRRFRRFGMACPAARAAGRDGASPGVREEGSSVSPLSACSPLGGSQIVGMSAAGH